MSEDYRDAGFIGTDYRANFKDVVAKRPDLLKRDGGRMRQAAAIYQAGTVLGLASSGADSGYYKPYVSSNTDGSQVAVGVLEQYTSVDANGYGSEISIIRGGILLKDLLIGLDSGAITNLGANILR